MKSQNEEGHCLRSNSTESLMDEISKYDTLFIHCPKCGCRNSVLDLRCWYCKTKLKN